MGRSNNLNMSTPATLHPYFKANLPSISPVPLCLVATACYCVMPDPVTSCLCTLCVHVCVLQIASHALICVE